MRGLSHGWPLEPIVKVGFQTSQFHHFEHRVKRSYMHGKLQQGKDDGIRWKEKIPDTDVLVLAEIKHASTPEEKQTQMGRPCCKYARQVTFQEPLFGELAQGKRNYEGQK